MPKFVLLWTDVSIWLMTAALVGYVIYVRSQPNLRANWRKVFTDRAALASSIVLLACLAVTLLDSVHYRRQLPPAPGAAANAPVAYDVVTRSTLDALLDELIASREATYSMPLATVSFTKDSVERPDGTIDRVAPRLKFGGRHLSDPDAEWGMDVSFRIVMGLLNGVLMGVVLGALLVAFVAHGRTPAGERLQWLTAWRAIRAQQTPLPWRTALVTIMVLSVLGGIVASLSGPYHALGTDLTGNDVLYQSLKSIRTAFVIGTLATIATLPLAVVLGILAGYFRGWVDEVVQYIYTVLSSIPNVLLIAACVLMVQVFLDKHPELFETGAERTDLKLFLLCAVLGLTGWAGLCRLLRAETLKLRELEYVQAATSFGVSDWKIMTRHIFPNVAHLMLIVTVLEFSGLILYEAVLSYVGVGVDPSMNSFGGMINLARNEMSRDPIVWWSFASAFVFMVTLVLAANLFSDGVRDAFDPRSRVHKPRVAKLRPSVAIEASKQQTLEAST